MSKKSPKVTIYIEIRYNFDNLHILQKAMSINSGLISEKRYFERQETGVLKEVLVFSFCKLVNYGLTNDVMIGCANYILSSVYCEIKT